MRKNLLTAVLVLAMAMGLSFAACSDETESVTESDPAEMEYTGAVADVNDDGKIIVGYISKNLEDPFHVTMNEYARERLEELVKDGVIDVWTGILDGSTDPQTQIDLASECVEEGCDFVILLPCEEEASDPAVVSMADAGINVIVVNSETLSTGDRALSFCGIDDVHAGELLGQWVLDNCPGGGKYVHCNGIIGNSAQIWRNEGIHNVLDPHKEFEMVGDEDTRWKGPLAAAAAENYIGMYGEELVAVICDNDDMSSEAQEACNRMGRGDVICIGVDGNQKPLEMIRDGELKATILQDGKGQIGAGIDAILQVIDEGKAPEKVLIPSVLVTKDNVDQYLQEE